MLIFGATANCIPWVYVPEILPLHVRAKGTAVGVSSNWVRHSRHQPALPLTISIWNFFVVMITPTIITDLQWKAYLIFMCLNISFVPLVYFAYPETANLTLEEIDWLFLEPDAIKTSLKVRKYGWGEESGKRRRHAAEVETATSGLPTEKKVNGASEERRERI